jgi:4-hydroxy-tetrahydrodipicolinate reductase
VTRILLVGYGKMGQLVGQLAGQYDCEIAGIVDPVSAAHTGSIDDERWNTVDVAVDFTSPDAVMTNVPALARRRINVVLGTTGWQAHEAELRKAVADRGSGIVAAPNFSTGVVLFEAMVAHAAALLAGNEEFGAWVYEAHHAAKKDAPSGTALKLKRAMEEAGYARPIDVASSRAGFIPGTHTVGFDGPSESITLTHTARDRGAFARGALLAAGWLKGRHGWFTMQDVLGLKT